MQNPLSPTRIGFIGAGFMATRHLEHLSTFDDVRIVAVADPSLKNATAFARRSAGIEIYDSYSSMIDQEALDALYICVPPFAHGDAEQLAISEGLPFFVEKPVALDLDTAEVIAQGVEASGLITSVGYHWRYLDIVDIVRDLLEERTVRLVQGFWLDSTPAVPWWGRKTESGGQIIEQATHILDLARFLVGETSDIWAIAAPSERIKVPSLDIDDVSVITLRFESGAIGTVVATCLLESTECIGLHLSGENFTIKLFESLLEVKADGRESVWSVKQDPFLVEDRYFVEAVRGGQNRIRVPYQEALKTHRLAVEAAHKAGRLPPAAPKLKI